MKELSGKVAVVTGAARGIGGIPVINVENACALAAGISG